MSVYESTEDGLVRVVDEQIRCAESMLRALDDEAHALLEADADGLNAAGATKARIIDALESLETERRGLTRSLDEQTGGRATGRARARWDRLLALMERCRERNAHNGSLLSARRNQLLTALRLVRGAESELYGTGGLQPAGPSKRGLGTA